MMGDFLANIDLDKLASSQDKTRVNISELVISYNALDVYPWSKRHAWFTKNKRATCGATVSNSNDEPYVPGDERNCVTCERQVQRWIASKK